MSHVSIAVGAESKAAPSALFALLLDGATWPHWSMFDSFELERAGQGGPSGVGAIRVFSKWLTHSREEIVEIVPDRKLGYVLLSGLPLRNYRADVVLTPRPDGGTAIAWTASFSCRFGSGWFWRLFMRWTLSSVAAQLAAAA